MNWTPEREEMLKQLWQQGLSASRIAQELGNTTRNAVIGKAHRLGLSGRTTRKVGPKPASSLSRRSTGNNARTPRPIARPRYIEPIERSAYAVDLIDLTEQHCKWPVGDPRSKEFHFCGGNRAESFPYCAYHASVAYHIPMRRTDGSIQEPPAAAAPVDEAQKASA